jgi:hypothetical protein
LTNTPAYYTEEKLYHIIVSQKQLRNFFSFSDHLYSAKQPRPLQVQTLQGAGQWAINHVSLLFCQHAKPNFWQNEIPVR